MINGIVIASMMICRIPNFLKGRLYLSACDSVWSPVEYIDKFFNKYLTDEIGNTNVEYGGFLQMIDKTILDLLPKKNLYACFRGVEKNIIKHIDVYPIERIYRNILNELIFVGWDVCTGSGWLSASIHGHFPIDIKTGNNIDVNAEKINVFGLFESQYDCILYCDINNDNIPEHAPWYPVAIFLDKNSYTRLKKYLEFCRIKWIS